MSPYLRSETPIPSWDDCAACSGTRQDYPGARANTARGLDGTRRKPEPHIPYKREWELLESATGDISNEGRHKPSLLLSPLVENVPFSPR